MAQETLELGVLKRRRVNLRRVLQELPLVQRHTCSWWSRLRGRCCSMLPQLHSRAAQPLLDQVQIQRLMRAAIEWGDAAIRIEYFRDTIGRSPTMSEEVRTKGLRSAGRADAVHEEEFRATVAETVHGTRRQSRSYHEAICKAVEAAQHWVNWRVRAYKGGNYGNCTVVVARAQWQYLECLLTLERAEK